MTQTQTEDFRRRAPAPLPTKPLNIPRPFETMLPNGLQIVIVEAPRLPLVSFRLSFRTGNASDPGNMNGLTSMMTGLLTEGTEHRTSKQIADEVARIGATLTAGANADYSTVAASALATNANQILDLLADVTLHPSFPENELELAKQNTKQVILQQHAQPSFLANERLSQIIFGQHPYSHVAPTNESVDAISRAGLMSFHKLTFVPNNAVLLVVGDVQHEAIVRRINELFGAWAKGQTRSQDFPALPARSERTIYIVDRPGSAQSNIVIANTSITRTSPDYFPMLVMHQVLGAGASSRLFMNLREAKGYTYGAYSNLDARRSAGTFRESAEVRTPVTGASLKEFLYELDRIRSEPVPQEEIANAKAYLTGVFPIRIETQEGLIDQLVQMKMLDLPADFLQTYRERVNAVTAADIQRVARQYVQPDRVAVVIVGDAAAIMDQIKPYAQNIELYDTAGNRKPTSTTANASASGGAPADINGAWKLQVVGSGGQNMPATLTINQSGSNFTGLVKASIGNLPVSNGTINGNSFDAAITINMQGQNFDGRVAGRVENNQLTGTITINFPNAPSLSFTGTRQQ
ncbi:MAG TPA: pitrilysin family protein [Pyrinomonadaceae bacterium]|nr:pitrilysin family protein [Pyrinomonadaceae bacterium]